MSGNIDIVSLATFISAFGACASQLFVLLVK